MTCNCKHTFCRAWCCSCRGRETLPDNRSTWWSRVANTLCLGPSPRYSEQILILICFTQKTRSWPQTYGHLLCRFVAHCWPARNDGLLQPLPPIGSTDHERNGAQSSARAYCTLRSGVHIQVCITTGTGCTRAALFGCILPRLAVQALSLICLVLSHIFACAYQLRRAFSHHTPPNHRQSTLTPTTKSNRRQHIRGRGAR